MIRTLLAAATLATIVVTSLVELQTVLQDGTQGQHMHENDLKDRCCWKRCRAESDLIFMGAGLCDTHYELAGSTFKGTYEYAVDRVIPAAARVMREQNEINTKETK